MTEKKRFIAILFFVIIVSGLWFVLSDGTPREAPAKEEHAPIRVAAPVVEQPELAEPAPKVSSTPAPRGQSKLSEHTEERADTATKPRGPGVIMVKLTPGDVEPRPGIKLTLHHVDWTADDVPKDLTLLATVDVGVDGEYEFTGLPLGRYAVLATGDGLYGEADTALTKRDSERAVNVALYESGAISGVVRNSAGEGIEGVTVFTGSLAGLSNNPSPAGRLIYAAWNAASRTQSDVNGNYVLSNLRYRRGDDAPAKYRIKAEAEGYFPETMPTVVPGTNDWDIVLSQGGSVSGEVADADSGQAMPGITVRVFSKRNPFDSLADIFAGIGQDQVDVTTDNEGRFTIATLSPGEHTAQVIHDELAVIEGPAGFTIHEGEDTTGLRFELTLGGSVSGRLYDADTGLGLAGGTVRVGGPGSFNPQKTDSAGDYVLRGLSAGTHTLSPGDLDGYTSGRSMKVTVRLGEEVPGVDFPLSAKKRQLPQISGMVTDWEGDPVAQATIHILPSGGSTKTRSDGSFTIEGVTPGSAEHYLGVRKPEQGLAHTRVGPLTVPKEGLANVKIVMEMGASIEGVIVDQNGNPVPGAYVFAKAMTERASRVPSAKTDERGAFKFASLAGGRFGLDPRKEEFYVYDPRKEDFNVPSANTVTLDAGQNLTGVRLVLEGLGQFTITGRVTNTQGEPVAEASVVADVGAFGRTSTSKTDQDGRYEIPRLANGIYEVTAGGSGYAKASETGIRAGHNRRIARGAG